MASKQTSKMKRFTAAFMSVVLASTVITFSSTGAVAEDTAAASTESSINLNKMSSTNRDNIYSKYISKYTDAAKPMKDIVINANEYAENDGAELDVIEFEGQKDVLRWSNQTGEVTWTFNVEEAGLYNMMATYFPVAGSNTTIEFELYLDGELPFDATKLIQFDRYWKDEHSIYTDSKDNQLRPPQEEYDCWINYPIKDKDGLINTPYYFYLSEGTHTLTLNGIKANLGIKSFKFYNTEPLPDYDAIKPTAEEIDATPALAGETSIKIEAEATDYKSASTLYPTYDRTDYMVSPSHPVKMRYNTIGADTWNKATQFISWEVVVPENGYYSINLKYRQNKMRGFFTNRRVLIDGAVPCQELDGVKFQYDPNWKTKELSDENGETIYVYLTSGKHEFTLEAIPGDIGKVMERLDDLIYTLNYYYRRILMITGPSPDQFNDYFIDTQIPELIPTFEAAIEQLYTEKDGIEALTKKGSEASALEALAVILKRACKERDEIPSMIGTIKDQISSVSAWMRDYRDQPLELDYIEFKTVHDKYENANGNFFESLAYGFNAFIGSFFEDYNSLSDSTTKSLNVWVSLGRDQANVVKELVDSDFNPSHATQVAINLVQGSVLEATLAGKGPEIALFLGGDFPVNLAARNLLVDLTEFSDYEEVKTRFSPDIETLYQFRDGIYGLPISQTFPMMFYRTDVLGELGFTEAPQTWDELIAMLPDIQRKYLKVGFILPSNITSQIFDAGNTFVLLMLQTGQDFYSEDLTQTTFNTEAAVDAFTKWTKFYTVYDFDQTYDAFTRFRTGEMPIVIQNYTFYNQLSVAAPEVKGLWDFCPIPGTLKTDESGNQYIDRTSNSGSAGAVIFEKVSDKQTAWEFVKWFTETETQVNYGRTIEALMGPMGRFDTANLEALEKLPWSTSEYQKIATQMSQLKEVPIIPASYAVTRNINNAFRAVVNDADNPRYSLSAYNRDINAEIVRKLKELGFYEGN